MNEKIFEIARDEQIRYVSVREAFANKNPRLAKLLPGFVYKYIEKIVHQDEINDILKRHGEKTGLDFIKAVIEEFNVFFEVEGLNRVPKAKKYIFVSNHPLGGFDGMFLLKILNENFGQTKVLVNDILMNIKNIRSLFVPINKHGKQSEESIILLDEIFKSDLHLLTFPAGLVSRKIKGQIVDVEWKKNFIVKSVKYQRDVVPIYVSGRVSEFFYKLANIRKFLGIKSNLEMFYLADETFKHKNKSFKVIFGSPIPYTTFDKSKTPKEWAKWVKEIVYQLANINYIPL